MPATMIYRNRIALIFDFDLTLAPDSFTTLLHHCGVAFPDQWRQDHVQPLVSEGWETILARIYCLSRLPALGGAKRPVTADLVAEAGRAITPFPGVPGMFGRLRAAAASVSPEIEVEFHLVTSGFVDLHRCTAFAGEFASIRGTEFHFGDNGRLAFARRVLTHPEKARHILALCKRLDPNGADGPDDVDRDVPDEQMHVPLDQVIYVGDGGSDMAAFGLLSRGGGIALAVFNAEQAQDWTGQSEMRAGHRVANLAHPDFSEGAELMRSLVLAVESIARKVELRRLGRGE